MYACTGEAWKACTSKMFDKLVVCFEPLNRGTLTTGNIGSVIGWINSRHKAFISLSLLSSLCLLFLYSVFAKKRDKKPDKLEETHHYIYTINHVRAIRQIRLIGLEPSVKMAHLIFGQNLKQHQMHIVGLQDYISSYLCQPCKY